MCLIYGKQLGEVTLSLTLGQLDLVRPQCIRLGLVVAEAPKLAKCKSGDCTQVELGVQFSFALQCFPVLRRNF